MSPTQNMPTLSNYPQNIMFFSFFFLCVYIFGIFYTNSLELLFIFKNYNNHSDFINTF